MPRRFDGINTQTKGVSKREDGIPESSKEEEKQSTEVDATDGARALASEYGINLNTAEIEGTGEVEGRIYQKDVEQYIEDNDLQPVSD